MNISPPQPSLLSKLVPQDWTLSDIRGPAEIWQGQVLIEKWHEPLRDKLYEPQGGFRHILTCWQTNKIMAAIRIDGKIVSYALLSQDGYYGTSLPRVTTDICLGKLGVWTHPDYRLRGYSLQALTAMYGVIEGLMARTEGDFYVVWVQEHVAEYMRSVARKNLNGLEFDILSFKELKEIPCRYGNHFVSQAI